MIKHVVLSLILTTQLGFGQALMESVLPQVDSFQEGEWFQLRLHYGPINASYATFSLERDTLEGKPVFHAKGFGETTGFARLFFKVEDYYESYFDEKNGTATVNDKKKAQINKFPTTEGVQDLISCFYFLRNFYPKDEIEINESFDINMFFDNENYVFKLKYLGKETVNSKFGKIECMKFRPLVQSGRVFEEQESVTLWVSDDDNRLPIRLQADILVGSIKADLENFKNLKHPFKIVVK